MSSIYIRVWIFSYNVVSLYWPANFLSSHHKHQWWEGISFEYSTLGFFLTSAKLSAVNFTLQLPLVLQTKLYDFVGYQTYFEAVYYLALGDNIVRLFIVNQRHSQIFSLSFHSDWGCFYQYIGSPLSIWILCGILSVHRGNNLRLNNESLISSLIFAVNIFHFFHICQPLHSRRIWHKVNF